jgi:RimJ/RimL family protein N-acetyltransferase
VIVTVTTRLELRQFSVAEAEMMVALNADPDVVRHTGDGPFASVDDARALLAGYTSYRTHGFGRWSVYRRDDRAYLGWCGLARDPDGSVNLGFRFFRTLWGRGFATEAAQASLALGFDRYGLDRIIGRARPENPASVRVLEKIGMRHLGAIERGGRPWLLLAVDRQASPA